jgi:hypothetical protein
LKLEQFAMVEAHGIFKIGKCGEHANAHDSCAIATSPVNLNLLLDASTSLSVTRPVLKCIMFAEAFGRSH